jgi:hypothetical protein
MAVTLALINRPRIFMQDRRQGFVYQFVWGHFYGASAACKYHDPEETLLKEYLFDNILQ